MIQKIDSNKFSLTILKVTTFSRIRHDTPSIFPIFQSSVGKMLILPESSVGKMLKMFGSSVGKV